MKKGIMFHFADWIICCVALILIWLLFFPIIRAAETQIIQEASDSVAELNANQALVNYLRATTSEGVSFADLISYSFANNNFKELEKETTELFDLFYKKAAPGRTGEKVWRIKFKLKELPSIGEASGVEEIHLTKAEKQELELNLKSREGKKPEFDKVFQSDNFECESILVIYSCRYFPVSVELPLFADATRKILVTLELAEQDYRRTFLDMD